MNLEFFSPLNELSRNICFAHSAHSWKPIRTNAEGWRTRRAICESLKRDGRLQQHQNHDASTCKISLRGALHADANWILIFRREFNSSWGRSAVPGRAWEMNRMDQDSVQLNKRFSERKKIISSTCIIQLKILSSCANVCRSPTFCAISSFFFVVALYSQFSRWFSFVSAQWSSAIEIIDED